MESFTRQVNSFTVNFISSKPYNLPNRPRTPENDGFSHHCGCSLGLLVDSEIVDSEIEDQVLLLFLFFSPVRTVY